MLQKQTAPKSHGLERAKVNFLLMLHDHCRSTGEVGGEGVRVSLLYGFCTLGSRLWEVPFLSFHDC